ncbi:MAG TPA: hypothetical protein VM534_01235 [Thermoanaerobaculia bacterium]|nr:hypothetical protein [Thermoanaerobaculia bacterium]
MKVNYYPGRGHTVSSIERFLTRHKVSHRMIDADAIMPKGVYKLGDLPAVEVDGRFFVNPNEDALRKILDIR